MRSKSGSFKDEKGIIMISKILPQKIKYDGSQIAPLWAYSMGIKGDSIVVFHGAMDVTPENMKDIEDLKAKKQFRAMI